MECFVCLEEYKGKRNPKIICQHCEAHACRQCHQRHLLLTYEDPHCVSCKRGWNSDFMGANFPISFRNGALRAHRRKVLFEREKTLLPALQIYAEYRRSIQRLTIERNQLFQKFGNEYYAADTVAYKYKALKNKLFVIGHNIERQKKEIRLLKQITAPSELPSVPILLKKARETRDALRVVEAGLQAEVAALEPTYLEMKEKFDKVSIDLRTATNLYFGDKAAGATRREFIMKCPAEECRGFLSTAYKCGTCEAWACVDCHISIGKEKDAAHTCDPNTVETAKAIKAETRPCPKCGTRIFKTDGCFAKDTPILLWNGSIKQSQDIIVGDTLIGDDGTSRTVEEICSGQDEMYRVDQGDGESYTVNSRHKLVLKFSGHKQIYWSVDAWKIRWFTSQNLTKIKKFNTSDTLSKSEALKQAEAFRDSLDQNDIFEITIHDYLALPNSTKKHLMGFKSAGIYWPEQTVHLEPYMLGLYLGDGINNGVDFAACAEKDPEIIQYLLKWCEGHNSELVHDHAYRFRIRRRGVEHGRYAMERGATSSNCKGCTKKICKECDLPAKPYDSPLENKDTRNQLKEALDYYNQIRNKHIPEQFLQNSRENRLRLLAGLIDTDGYLGNDGKRVFLSQSNHKLLRQIEFLARSLGFITHVDRVEKKNISINGSVAKDYPDHLRLCISGSNLSDIPTLIARKKCVDSSPNKDMLRTSITVSHLGRGEYYGWSISDNKRFILQDTTVVRNCDQMWCVMEGCGAAFSWNTGNIVTGMIHNPHYLEWLKRKQGGILEREAGDIPCGGMPNTWQMVGAFRDIDVPDELTTVVLESFRNLQELIDLRMRDYPSRLPQLANKEDDVDYLLNEISEDVWQQRLERTESKFLKKKEIGQILQTLATAGSDMMNRMYERATQAVVTTEKEKEFVDWLLDTGIPELEQLRAFGNESLQVLGRRDKMAVPQFEENWSWKGLRALYSKKGPAATEIVETVATES